MVGTGSGGVDPGVVTVLASSVVVVFVSVARFDLREAPPPRNKPKMPRFFFFSGELATELPDFAAILAIVCYGSSSRPPLGKLFGPYEKTTWCFTDEQLNRTKVVGKGSLYRMNGALWFPYDSRSSQLDPIQSLFRYFEMTHSSSFLI